MCNEKYMRRALQLARKGSPYCFPNPMVGAVITSPDGTIIGEGYHRKCGEGHAEVNAINSVSCTEKLKEATIYVTLEPCAHYGRTAPCSKLIIDRGIPNVVVGCRDPFDQVNGKGIEMLREAGVNVTVGVLEEQCKSLNAIFFTAHTLHRPFITLKWAQSADGFLDMERTPDTPPAQISNVFTKLGTHHLRAIHDGILVGSETVLADNPMLDNRLWPGKSPRPIILDRRGRIGQESRILQRDPIIIKDDKPIEEIMHDLYNAGITSVLVEGGAKVHRSLIEAGLWDLARVEIGENVFGSKGRVAAPDFGNQNSAKIYEYDNHFVKFYAKNPLIDVKNI